MNFTIAALPCPRKFCAGSSRVAFGASRLSIAAESCAFQARKYAATTASPLSGTGGFFSTAQANTPAATRDPKANNFFGIQTSGIEKSKRDTVGIETQKALPRYASGLHNRATDRKVRFSFSVHLSAQARGIFN